VGREIRYHASTVHPPSPLDSLNDGRASADARRNISTPNFFSGEGGHRPPSTEKFKVRGILGEYEDLKIRLLGEHQLINAAAAIGAIEALKMQGIKVGVDAIRKGLYNTLWPGRAEVVSRKPYIVLDGAQNQASARALKEAILENFQYQKMILVLGISQDKDIKGICRELIPLADEIVLTQANNPRAAPVGKIEKVIIVHRPPSYAKASEGRQSTDHSKKSRGPCLPTGKAGTVDRGQILKSKDVKQALKLAKIKATKKDLILVTGSLFVVGEARELLKK
jgi:dihydrofolate synthase/folylpolyglutamate synthase